MKKTILAVMMVFGFANILSANDMWVHYGVASSNTKAGLRALENAAPESLSITSADKLVEEYAAVRDIANQLRRDDLITWTLNNAAYAKIVLFKKLVRYDESNAAINALNPKDKQRTVLVKALQVEYVKNKSLLEEAVDLLTQAVQVGQHLENNTKQWSRIVSNRQFAMDSLIFIDRKF
jgi:hypothetical protein